MLLLRHNDENATAERHSFELRRSGVRLADCQAFALKFKKESPHGSYGDTLSLLVKETSPRVYPEDHMTFCQFLFQTY